MKRIFVLFALIFSVAVSAQQTQTATTTPNQEKAHASALKMQKLLGLTEEQTTKVESINLSRLAAIDAVKMNTNLTPEQKEVEIGKIRTEKEAEFMAVLTPEQQAKYTKMKEDKKKRKEAAGQNAGGND